MHDKQVHVWMHFHCIVLGDDIHLRNAIKQLKLHTLPKVFIIHLKRFSIDHIVTKNSTHVKYPMILDVGPYCTEVSKHHCIYTHYDNTAAICS